NVGPVLPRRRSEIAFPVARVPFGVLTYEDVVPCGMVRDPVEDDVHVLLVCCCDEVLEIVQSAELGIHAVIILYGVGASQGAFAILFANFVDRHQPQDVDAQLFQAGQLLLRSPESAFWRELAGVDLVDGGVLTPVRMLDLDVGYGLIGVRLIRTHRSFWSRRTTG